MTNISLSNNHKRSLSASIYAVEKMADEFERELTCKTELSMLNLVNDLSAEEMDRYKELICRVKEYVAYMKKKYGLTSIKRVQSRIINAKRVKMWEILSDTKSKRMKGFGKFPEELSTEYDSDLEGLLKLIGEI